MRHFIIASHGPLSAAILKSASLIAGEDIFRRFACIQVAMEDSGRSAKDFLRDGRLRLRGSP